MPDNTAKVLIKSNFPERKQVLELNGRHLLTAFRADQGTATGVALLEETETTLSDGTVSRPLNRTGEDRLCAMTSNIAQPIRNKPSSQGKVAGAAMARVRGLRSTLRRSDAAAGRTNTTSGNTSGCDTDNLRPSCMKSFTCYLLWEPPDTAIPLGRRGAKRDLPDLSFYTGLFFPSGLNGSFEAQLLRLVKIRNEFSLSTKARIRVRAGLPQHVLSVISAI
jgi:hypothetical protein